jgi:hypothetical protein
VKGVHGAHREGKWWWRRDSRFAARAAARNSLRAASPPPSPISPSSPQGVIGLLVLGPDGHVLKSTLDVRLACWTATERLPTQSQHACQPTKCNPPTRPTAVKQQQESLTAEISDLIPGLTAMARSTVRELDPLNDLEFLRVRSVKHEIMVAPSELLSAF